MAETVFHTCPLCEATCGLAFEVENGRIVAARPDADDVFSKGCACPKGIATAEIHNDPDRVRRPLRRRADGSFEEIGWDQALDEVAARLKAVRAAHGADAVGFYWGNPTNNNFGAVLLIDALTKALGTRNRFGAGSQDANPRLVASSLLYGSYTSIPVPDVDRTDYFLCLGANPVVSNGSIMTAPDMKGRLRAIRARGGKVVVVDPRRSETAAEADEYVAIRPGSDAAFLFAIVNVLFEEGLADTAFLEAQTTGLEAFRRRVAAMTPERVADFIGVDAATTRRLARELAAAPSSVVYARMGVAVSTHATLANAAADLVNVVLGRVGTVGGSMFPRSPFGLGNIARRMGMEGRGRWKSRVRGLPETMGDLPAAVMLEEMTTPGEGQIRAFITFAGNPVLSTANARALSSALADLDFMVSIDLYVNETSRHADYILPPCWDLAEEHADLVFSSFAVRNVVRYSPPVVRKSPGERSDWEILLGLTERLGGGPLGDPVLDRLLAWLAPLGLAWTPTAMAGLLLRLGPHGDGFLPWSSGLNLARLKEAAHGVDLGPLEPGFAHQMHHKGGRIHLEDGTLAEGWSLLEADLAATAPRPGLVLIGRREQRTNNSWTHNVPSLVAGKERCLLYVHPQDAERAGVHDGGMAELSSRVHLGPVKVKVTDEVMPGVVSLPHGWGHAEAADFMKVAGAHPGVNANDWTDQADVEPIIGQSILNGVAVELMAV